MTQHRVLKTGMAGLHLRELCFWCKEKTYNLQGGTDRPYLASLGTAQLARSGAMFARAEASWPQSAIGIKE